MFLTDASEACFFLIFVANARGFFQNSSPLPGDILFSITVVVMWWLCALLTADMHGLLLRKKKNMKRNVWPGCRQRRFVKFKQYMKHEAQCFITRWNTEKTVFFIFEVFHRVMKHCVECFILCLIIYDYMRLDWLRAVVFQLNLKYLHVKITNLLRVVV